MGKVIYFACCESLSHVQLFVTPRTAARQASLFFTISGACSNTSTESVMILKHLIHPLSSPSLPAFNLSQHQGLFQRISSSHQVAKYWSFCFTISPFNGYSELIPFRIHWLYLIAIQGILKNLLQHSSKASILCHSVIFTAQLSHPHMTTGKTIALTRQTCCSKVMSLLFNMLSRLVIVSLPKNKCFLISWLQSPSAVILEPKKIKSLNVSIISPSICHKGVGTGMPLSQLFEC